MSLSPTAGGHAFLPGMGACAKCGMTREAYEDKREPCKGKPPDDRTRREREDDIIP
jgi:hypothetical protein